MIITDIKRKGKSELYKIFINDNFFALFEVGVIHKYKLKIGTEIDESSLKQIQTESDNFVCGSLALNYVSKKLCSEKDVKDYLKKQKFSAEGINLAINKLKDYGYINDESYAKSYAESLKNGHGNRYIADKLKQKGISEQIISNLLEQNDGENDACIHLAQKWLRGKNLPLDVKDKQKLIRHLLSRGFNYECVRKALGSLNEDMETEYDWN